MIQKFAGAHIPAKAAIFHHIALFECMFSTPMLHKKDGKNLTNRYVRRIYFKFRSGIRNKPAVYSMYGLVFLHIFYPTGKPEDFRSGVAKGLQ
jgi:hypothetical protein